MDTKLQSSHEKKLLLIGKKKKFMVKAVADGLGNNGYFVSQVEPDATNVSHAPSDIGVYLLYLDDDIPEELYFYLKDIFNDKDIHLFIIGDIEEIEEAKKALGNNIIEAAFERPFNVDNVSEKLDKAFESQEKKREMKKILVIDDDGNSLYSIQNILSSKYRVFIANSGTSAIAFLASNEVDLILLDYEMPVVNGPKVLEMLRSESSTASIPVMFLTSKSDKESVMSVVSLKPDKYLLKTMPAGELIRNIDDFFASHVKRE